MKQLFTTIFGLLPFYMFSQLYVSPTGLAGNSGTIDSPTTLVNALSIISPGQTIYMRGGTYLLNSTIVIARTNSGTAGNLKRIEAYTGEIPILDFSAQTEASGNRGVILDGLYWYIKGITFKKAGDNGMLLSGNFNTIDNCVFEKNRDTGLQLSRYNGAYTSISQWPSNNLILNCESFDNKDALSENADGFAAKLTCGAGNIFRGCLSHNNIDDGWDLFTNIDTGPIGAVSFENCVAYNNGRLTDGTTSVNGDKNGFKLGGSGIPVNHIVRRCIAFGNGQHGFTDNNNLGAIEMSNNTSVNNTYSNYNFRAGGSHQFRNNVSYNPGSNDVTTGTNVGQSNVWFVNNLSTNGRTPPIVSSAADFITLTNPTVMKNPDGSPNLGNFVALNLSSDFINAGVTATGILFNGSAPDLGARETGAPLGTPVTESQNFEAKLYPNPIANNTIHLNVTSPVTAETTISLFSVNGQILVTLKKAVVTGENDIEINTTAISEGLYFLSIKSDDYIKTLKVIVK